MSGAAADGALLLEQARRAATTAAGLVASEPHTAYGLADGAARFACVARWLTKGGAPKPAVVTTRSNRRSALSSALASGRSGCSGVAATSRSTPHMPADTAGAPEADQAAATAQRRLITAAGTPAEPTDSRQMSKFARLYGFTSPAIRVDLEVRKILD